MTWWRCGERKTSPAMAVLESGYEWLEFADHQYLDPPDRPTPADVAPALGATIAECDPTSVFFPMGLANPDHVMVHDACLLVRQEQPERRGSATRTTATSTCPACWPARRSCCAPIPGQTPAIVPHVPDEEQALLHLEVLHVADRAARAGPRRADRAHGGPRPGSTGSWQSRQPGGKGWPTSSGCRGAEVRRVEPPMQVPVSGRPRGRTSARRGEWFRASRAREWDVDGTSGALGRAG